MIKFIFGRAGSGKTDTVCKMAADSLSAGRRVFLIVPEQMAVDAETRMSDLIGDMPSLSLEILNFRRLCNRVFREYGGLSYSYISNSGRMLMMWQTLSELAPMLNFCTKIDKNSVARMLSAVDEFKSYCITPRALERAAEDLKESERGKKLSDKLYDLSLIYASFTNLISQTCDDACDDLTKVADLLRQHNFFSDADVYFDSFYGFTPQEFSVIEAVIRSADNAAFSLCLDSSDELFENQRKTADRLAHICKSAGKNTSVITLSENLRSPQPELRHIEKWLWAGEVSDESKYTANAPALSLVECQNRFAECEAVAADIYRRVRCGARWRDFAITTRGIENYDGILDVILEKYGIPHFVSRRTDIKNKPVIKLILSALSLKIHNFRTDDIISYIKTGLCPLTPDEVSAFENYIETWKIRGSARFRDDFTMNPLGYTAKFTEKSVGTLAVVNDIRGKVIEPLLDFHTELDAANTVRDFSRALYSFLCKLELPQRLENIAAKYRSSDAAAAQEYEQIWSVLIDSLDELCTVMPEFCADTETFAELLNLIFEQTDIGSIPSTVDEVISGDAARLRSTPKHVYIIGANEGLFPLAPTDGGVFSDADRKILSTIGLELAEGAEYQCTDERFIFYRAATCASESLTVLWSISDLSGKSMKPSLAITRLQSLFPTLKTIDFSSLPIEERLESRANIIEYIAECDGTPLGKALREYAKSDTELSRRIERLSVPLSSENEHLSKESAKALLGGSLALSHTKLETYVQCHLSYFCKYALRLDERESADFSAADIGTFVHHILEAFVKTANERGTLEGMDDDDIEVMVSDIVSDYMQTVCKIAPDLSGSRLAHLFARLKRSSGLLCKSLVSEFAQSRFTPKYYELPINFKHGGEPSVEPISVKLSDGSDAYVYGTVDRVDVMERDGKYYVRVVDYKTNSKDFSLDNVSLGLDMQMLIYLFSLWKNGQSAKSTIDVPEGAEIIPAGILYFGAEVSTLTLDKEEPAKDAEAKIIRKIGHSGLLLDDMEVLRAMDSNLSGIYLPVKLKKDGEISGSESLMPLDGFKALLTTVEENIRQIGDEIKRGNASANPLKQKGRDACQYCKMRPICRKSNKGGDR